MQCVNISTRCMYSIGKSFILAELADGIVALVYKTYSYITKQCFRHGAHTMELFTLAILQFNYHTTPLQSKQFDNLEVISFFLLHRISPLLSWLGGGWVMAESFRYPYRTFYSRWNIRTEVDMLWLSSEIKWPRIKLDIRTAPEYLIQVSYGKYWIPAIWRFRKKFSYHGFGYGGTMNHWDFHAARAWPECL